MPRIDNDKRVKLRLDTRDFILKAGSPVTNNQIADELETNNHMTDRIINEFKDAEFIKPFYLGKNTDNPITAWQPTEKLQKMNKEAFKDKLSEITKIEKPRDR